MPVLFLGLRAAEARGTRREVAHLGFAAAAAGVLGLATWRYGFHWLDAFGPLCRQAEDSGFDLLGVADSQSVFRELYVSLTVAALNTSRIRLGPLVTNPQTRHLVVTASAVASVDELSGGRMMLGLGSGDSAIYTLGAPPATVAGLEDAVITLGRLTTGVPGAIPGAASTPATVRQKRTISRNRISAPSSASMA